jgi:hypothetical protein
MKEFMYDIDVGVIAGILFVSTVAALEVGYRVGIRIKERTDEPSRAHIHLTETATLSLLALLLAFTFSLSLQRYDSRSDQVVDEANAIGTAYLRIDLLPPSLRDEVRGLMREYVNQRVKSSTIATSRESEWRASVAEAWPVADGPVVVRRTRGGSRSQPGPLGNVRPGAQRHDRLLRPARRRPQAARARGGAAPSLRRVPDHRRDRRLRLRHGRPPPAGG